MAITQIYNTDLDTNFGAAPGTVTAIYDGSTAANGLEAYNVTTVEDVRAVDGIFSGNVSCVDATLTGQFTGTGGAFSGALTGTDAEFSGYLQSNESVAVATANGASVTYGYNSELMTIAAAASSDSTANLLPADAIIDAVVVRVTTVIPTAATFTVGDATQAARFATGVAVAATTTAVGTLHWNPAVASDNLGPRQTADAKIRITPNAQPADATGRVRVTVFYHKFVAPTG